MLQDYSPPGIWCQFAIRYTKTEVTLFLNGNVTAIRPIDGELGNTQADSTIGLAFVDCLPYFWTGCLDDVSIALIVCALTSYHINCHPL